MGRATGWRLAVGAALVAAAVAACASAPTSSPPPSATPIEPARTVTFEMPHPERARMQEALRINDGCVTCHADIAAEWKGSLHQRADLEPAYRRSFAIEPLPFCRACHAPEAVATDEEPEAIANLGVGCVTCHVTEGSGVLASSQSASSAGGPSPHVVQRTAAFGSTAACAGCHEFQFPLAHDRRRQSLMQSTVTEHAESPAAGRACADCHMPRRPDGKRSHAFIASRDPETLKRAARIAATRLDSKSVEVTLEPVDPGHAFPTGDLFRRIEVWAEAAGPDEMSLASTSRYLTRHWTIRPGQTGRVLLGDDRLDHGPMRVRLEVGDAAAGHDIVWRVAYQRVAHPNGIDDANAEVDGEVVLASGRLAP